MQITTVMVVHAAGVVRHHAAAKGIPPVLPSRPLANLKFSSEALGFLKHSRVAHDFAILASDYRLRTLRAGHER